MSLSGGPRRRLTAQILKATASKLKRRPLSELVVVFLAIPTVLVAVHLVPGSRAWSLSLGVDSPFVDRRTLWTAFASNYVHVGTSHLLNNVGVYLLTMAAIYPVAVAAGWRRKLAGAAAGYLLGVPIVVSWVSIRTLGQFSDYPAAGFSGVNAAFLGFLLVVWFVAYSEEPPDADSIAPAWALVPFALALTVAFAIPRNAGLFPADRLVAALFLVVAVVAAVGFVWFDGDPRGAKLPAEREFMYVFGMSVVIAGVLGSLVFVAPGTNVYAHLAGFVVGFGVPFLGFVLPRLAAT